MDGRARSAQVAAELLAVTRDRLDVSPEAAIASWDPSLDPQQVASVRVEGRLASPDALIGRYEALVAAEPDERVARGAWFTPPPVVEGVLDLAGVKAGERVCDPACGAGAFLLAAWRRGARVSGMDVDPAAVAAARGALWWASGAPWSRFGEADVVQGDALLTDWSRTFDAVVGNPPFLGQLSRATAFNRQVAAALADRYGVTAYADAAALFQLLAASLLAPGGRSALLAPASWLGARDSGPIRRRLAADLDPVAMWLSMDRSFPQAMVFPTLVVLQRGGSPPPEVRRALDSTFRSVAPLRLSRDAWRAADTWSPFLASATGIPSVAPSGPLLESCATVHADFRDQYYGLVDAIREGEDGPRLVTVGAIGLGRCRWGEARIRFGGRSWERPVVDRAALTPAMTAWAEARCVPKLLVATQKPTLCVAVDERGSWLPSVPVISVVPRDPSRLWHLAAALASPPAAAWAASRSLGTGLSPRVIKLAAREVRQLPLPSPGPAWDRAAEALRQLGAEGGDPAVFARLATEAYGIPVDPLVPWFLGRLRGRAER